MMATESKQHGGVYANGRSSVVDRRMAGCEECWRGANVRCDLRGVELVGNVRFPLISEGVPKRLCCG